MDLLWTDTLDDMLQKDNKLSAIVILIVIKKLASNDALLQLHSYSFVFDDGMLHIVKTAIYFEIHVILHDRLDR